MSELLDFVIVSMVLVAIGIYGLVVKRNAIRMLFSIEIIVNAANLLLVAFSRGLPNAQGQVVALFSIAIAAAEVAVGLGLSKQDCKKSYQDFDRIFCSLVCFKHNLYILLKVYPGDGDCFVLFLVFFSKITFKICIKRMI